MRTARSLIVSPYLIISHATPPRTQLDSMPPSSYQASTPSEKANHAHAPPEQPRMQLLHAPQAEPCMTPMQS